MGILDPIRGYGQSEMAKSVIAPERCKPDYQKMLTAKTTERDEKFCFKKALIKFIRSGSCPYELKERTFSFYELMGYIEFATNADSLEISALMEEIENEKADGSK